VSKPSKEALLIIEGLKGKGKKDEGESEEPTSDEGDSDTKGEAARAACEGMLKVVFRGREPSAEEASEFEEYLDSYLTAKGY